jgi:transmembrane sensor
MSSNLFISQAKADQIPIHIVEEAIAWHLQLHSTQDEADTRTQFEAWLKQDDLHASAYQRIEKIFQPFNGINGVAAKESIVTVLQEEHKLSKRKGLQTTALGLVIVLSVYLGLQSQPIKILLADNKTEIGEIKTLTLPDHSYITMNTDSALDVQFDEHTRTVKLYKGEVLVKVSKDASRPFLVMTEHGSARALGTQFNVQTTAEITHVGVIESTVEACNTTSYTTFGVVSSDKPSCVILQPNQGVDVYKQKLGDIQEIDADALSSWALGTIAFDNQPLPVVLAELQRYSKAKIEYSPTALNQIKVSGVLPVNDIPHAFTILARQFDLQISQPNPQVVQISAQQ